MMELDKNSLLIKVDTDHTIREIEEELNHEGYTLNYRPVPGRDFLLADVLNERVPNLYENAYGGIEDLCVQIQLAQSDSSVFTNVLAPRSATGPCLKKIAIGASESLGIPVQASLKIFYKPEQTEVACIYFSTARQMDFFVQAVRKHRIPLPLICSFSSRVIKKYFEGFDNEAFVLSLALWGAKPVVAALASFLRELASRKHGEWVELGGRKTKMELLKVLEEEAIKEFQVRLNRQNALSPSHRAVMKMVQNIL